MITPENEKYLNEIMESTDGLVESLKTVRALPTIEGQIIAILEREEELYGLQILDRLNQGRKRELGFGSLYPVLNWLEKHDAIAWRWGDGDETTGGHRRKYYRLVQNVNGISESPYPQRQRGREE